MRIEPLRGCVCAGPKNRLGGDVGANGVFAQDRAGVGGIAENGNREREARLNLINGGQCPVVRERADWAGGSVAGNVVHGAQCEAMADVAGQALFCRQVAVVLWNRGFEHR